MSTIIMLGDGMGKAAGQIADGWTEEGLGLFQLFRWPHAWEWPDPLAVAGLKRRTRGA